MKLCSWKYWGATMKLGMPTGATPLFPDHRSGRSPNCGRVRWTQARPARVRHLWKRCEKQACLKSERAKKGQSPVTETDFRRLLEMNPRGTARPLRAETAPRGNARLPAHLRHSRSRSATAALRRLRTFRSRKERSFARARLDRKSV